MMSTLRVLTFEVDMIRSAPTGAQKKCDEGAPAKHSLPQHSNAGRWISRSDSGIVGVRFFTVRDMI